MNCAKHSSKHDQNLIDNLDSVSSNFLYVWTFFFFFSKAFFSVQVVSPLFERLKWNLTIWKEFDWISMHDKHYWFFKHFWFWVRRPPFKWTRRRKPWSLLINVRISFGYLDSILPWPNHVHYYHLSSILVLLLWFLFGFFFLVAGHKSITKNA